jgi:hypothetical protein
VKLSDQFSVVVCGNQQTFSDAPFRRSKRELRAALD